MGHGRLALLAPLIAAAIVRFGLAFAARGAEHLGDEATLVQLARLWEAHGVYTGDWPPGYPWLLKGLFALAGEHAPNVARGLNAFVSVLGVGATMVLGHVVGGRRVAIAAGWGAALLLSNAVWSALLYTEAFFVLVATVVYTLLARALRASEGRRTALLAAGVLMGAGCWLRAAGTVIFAGAAVGVAAALFGAARAQGRGLRRASLDSALALLRLAVPAMLVLLPLAVRNARVAGESAWLSPTGEGNVNLGWSGVLVPFERAGLTDAAIHGAPLGGLRRWFEAPGPALPTLQEIRAAGDPSAWARARVRTVVAEHPGWALRSRLVYTAELVSPMSFLHRALRLGQLEPLRVSPWLRRGVALGAVLGSLLLGLAVAASLGRGAGERSWWWLVGGVTAAHLAIPALMFGITRFRAPLEPLWIVAAALVLAPVSARSTGLRRVFALALALAWAACMALAWPVVHAALAATW